MLPSLANKPSSRTGRRSLLGLRIVALFLASLWQSPVASAQTIFPLTHSARLTKDGGAPVEGPVAVKVSFWDDVSGGRQLGSSFDFDSVPLTNGVMSITMAMTGAQTYEVFGDGSVAVYIEVTAADKVYPRQAYSFIPFALRVPVDPKTLKFDPSGKLTLATTPRPSANHFLTQDASGLLTWGKPEVSAQTVDGAVASSGQVLTYTGTQWVAADLNG